MESSFYSIPSEVKGSNLESQMDDSSFDDREKLSNGIDRKNMTDKGKDIHKKKKASLKKDRINIEYYKLLNKIRKSKKTSTKFRYICKICGSVRNLSNVDKVKTIKAIDIQFFGLLLRARNVFRYYALKTINCLYDKQTNIYIKALIPFVNISIYNYLGKLKRIRKRLTPPNNISSLKYNTHNGNGFCGNENRNGKSNGISKGNNCENKESCYVYSTKEKSKTKGDGNMDRYLTEGEINTKRRDMQTDSIIDIISRINFDSDTADDMSDDSFSDSEIEGDFGLNIYTSNSGEEGKYKTGEHVYKYKYTDKENEETGISGNTNMENEEHVTKDSGDLKEEKQKNYSVLYNEVISFFLNLQSVNSGEDIIHNILYDTNLNDIDADADIYFMRKKYEFNNLGRDKEENEEEEKEGEKKDESVRENGHICKTYEDNNMVHLGENKSTRELVNCVNEIGYSSKGIKKKMKKEKEMVERKEKEATNKKTDIKSVNERSEPKKMEDTEEGKNEGSKEEKIDHSDSSSYSSLSSLSSAPTLYDFSGCGKKVSIIKYMFYILYEHIKIKEALAERTKQEEEQKNTKKKQNSNEKEKEEKQTSDMEVKEDRNSKEEHESQEEINNEKTEETEKNEFPVDPEEMQTENRDEQMNEKEKENNKEQEQKEGNPNENVGKKMKGKRCMNMEVVEDIGDVSDVLMSDKNINATIIFLNNAIIRLKYVNYVDSYFYLLNRLVETFHSCHPIAVLCLEIFMKYVHQNNFVYLLSEDNINKFYANVTVLFSITRLMSEKQMLYKLYSTIYTCLKYKYVEKKSMSIFTCPIGYMSVELNLFLEKLIHDARKKDIINQIFISKNMRSELATVICQNIEQIIDFLSFHINFQWTQEEVINNINMAREKKLKKPRFRSIQNSRDNHSFFVLRDEKENETETNKNDIDQKRRNASGNLIDSQNQNVSRTRFVLRSSSRAVKENAGYEDPLASNADTEELDYFEYEYLSASHVNAILVQLSYMIEYVIEALVDLAKTFHFLKSTNNQNENNDASTDTYMMTENMKKYRLEKFLEIFRPQLHGLIRFLCTYILYENVFHIDDFIKVIDFCAYCVSESNFHYLLLLDTGIEVDKFYKKDIFLSKMFHYVFSSTMQGVNYMSLPFQIFYKYTYDLMQSIKVNERKNVTGNLEMINTCKNDYKWIAEASVDIPKLKGVHFVYIISNNEYQRRRDLSFQRNIENVIYYVYDFFFNYYFFHLSRSVKIIYRNYQQHSLELRDTEVDLVQNNFYNKTNFDMKRDVDIYVSSMNVLLSVCAMLFIRFDSSLLMRFLDKSECLFIFDCFFSGLVNVKQTEESFRYFREQSDLSILRKLCNRFTKILYMMLYHHPLFVSFFIHRLKTQKLGHVFQKFFKKNKSGRKSQKIVEEYLLTFVETHA